MIKRANVLIVFYDLPSKEANEVRKVNRFRKELLRLGYMRVQKSVYAKLIHNRNMVRNEILKVELVAPKDGEINVLCMSLNEFKQMKIISGEKFDMSLFSDEIIEI